MVRRRTESSTETTDQNVTENTEAQEAAMSTATEETVAAEATTDPSATEATEVVATEAKPEPEPIDSSAFEAALQAAFENRDESTGVVPEAFSAKVVAEYQALPGARGKAVAKRLLQAGMEEGISKMDLPHARVFIDLQKVCVPAASTSTKEKVEKEPVDPAEGAAARVAILRLAHNHAADTLPEGVEIDRVNDLVSGLVEKLDGEVVTYLAWLNTEVGEGEDEAPEPSVSVIAKKAAKLATGAAASAGGSKSGATGSRSTFVGKRGNILSHMKEAFANEPSGKFLTVNQIADFVSAEYTSTSVDGAGVESSEFRRPSQGAISARLFPTGDKKLNLEDADFVPAEEGGKKGARKN